MNSLPGHLAACLTATVLFLLLLAHFALGNKAIELSVRPQLAVSGPVNLTVRIHTRPTEQDHWIRVEMDSGTFWDASEFKPRPDVTLYTREWKDVPEGHYEIVAAIGSGDQIRATDRQLVQIGVP